MTPIHPTILDFVPFYSLGCWKEDVGAEVIPSLEETHPILMDDPLSRSDAVFKCYNVADAMGYPVFALQGGTCLSGPDAELTFSTNDRSENCVGGKGGTAEMDVYKIFGKGIYCLLLVTPKC